MRGRLLPLHRKGSLNVFCTLQPSSVLPGRYLKPDKEIHAESRYCVDVCRYIIPIWECNVKSSADYHDAIEMLGTDHQDCEGYAVQCTNNTAGFTWKMSTWTKCSKSCGGGKQHRQVICSSMDGIPSRDENCRPELREVLDIYHTSRSCNTNPCALHTWQV